LVERELPKLEVTGSRPVRRFSAQPHLALWGESAAVHLVGGKLDVVTTDAIGLLVRRLARPHASGGTVIERSVILAEGDDSGAILDWISEHDGVADSTVAPARSSGLHGLRESVRVDSAPARRFVLPANAFD
jgi:hypothetical protein